MSAPVAPALFSAPIAVSSRTHRGFRAPARRRAPAPVSLPLVPALGADWAFAPDRRLAPVAPAPAAPVLRLVEPLPAPVVAPVVDPAPAPVSVPAGAASVRVPSASLSFRVVVVDLDDDSESSVLVSAPSALAARRECSDEFAAPVAVFAVLPGGVESLVWGSAA
jgi:hypothetical protein